MNGGSEERYAYTPRGKLSSIDSSYGAIVQSMAYDPQGAPKRIVYGDVRGATANFVYDDRHRLTVYQLIAPSSGFPLPIGYFDYRFSEYDDVGNPLVIEDVRIAWQPSPVAKRVMQYDDFYRLTRIDYTYKVPDGVARWRSPFESETSEGDHHPVPLRSLPTRVKQQTFDYDGLGNLTASSDDLSARYDRSLGPNLGYGTPQDGPNQLRSGEGLEVRYDAAGNLAELKINRLGNCPTGAASQCAQWFAYDWDEVGQLARARRWDFDGNAVSPQASPDALPAEKPSWDLSYAYSQGARVRKSVADAAGVARHTLEVFPTLRVEQAAFNSSDGNYSVARYNVHAYAGGMAHVFWDGTGQLPHQAPNSLITMHMVIGDHLGSSSVAINHATSELVERTTFQPYGAVESDYRPSKWKDFREPYKFTGKEEDIEVGATYFGARYYQPYLGRFMSADPLTIHGLGGDLNPYAYVGGQVMTHVDPFGLCPPVVTQPGGTTVETTDCPDPPAKAQDASMQADRGEAAASQAGRRQMTPLVREHPESSPGERPSAASVAGTAALAGLKETALFLVDPLHVNRSFVNDIIGASDPKASIVNRTVAGAGAVLAVIPLIGEARGVLGVAKSGFSTVARVAELRSAIPVLQQGRITMAVGLAVDAKGVQKVLIASSEAASEGNAYFRPGVTLKPGEIPVTGIGDAEEKIVLFAQKAGLTLLEVGATRPICVVCAWLIDVAGATAVTPLKAPRPPLP